MESHRLIECKNLLSIFVLSLFVCIHTSNVAAESSLNLSQLATPCLACHSVTAEKTGYVGPTLAGVAGRALGTDPKYVYSDAFVRKSEEGSVWDRNTLNDFLMNPQGFVEGNAMNYPGIQSDAERDTLLHWLLNDPSGDPAALKDANYSSVPEVQSILARTADVEYGEYLAGECLTCHQLSDSRGQIPPIHKLTRDYLVFALLEYQNGTRDNSTMQSVVSSLSDEDIAALSQVFARIE